ncbi:MAG: leucyl aminopeptidase, partial [Candidatus Cloacimonetes bacterium]|nr:leucyl aminopeptidase [Candidatus Cloacimonadota bacterium]
MKIDIIRKLPEHLDTIIVMQEENGAVKDVEHLSPELVTQIEAFLKHEDYCFRYADIRSFCRIIEHKRQNVILLGAGIKDLLNVDKLRNLIALALRTAARLKAKQVFLFPGFFSHENEVSYGHVLAEAGLLTAYRFDKYQSSEKHEPVEALHYVLNTHNTRHLNRGILEGRIFAEATNLARDMVNEPANVMTPEVLAETAKKAALQYGLSVDVLSLDKLKRMKMDAFLAVGRGSVHEPR